ncbi:LysR substrate-binding domain-containing protein [Curtobacterium sp. L1-20]|uniref:LysR substrate-binding domain-containing protein n=1 Tax=Curtobacterium sp. L1-20 TaxID=3138181 RepID=UPI003B529812
MTSRPLTDRALDLDTLVVLERIAETGSISRAADALGVTQQAVSARLRSAEASVGHRLVDRSASGSVLSETGRLVLGLAAPVLEAARRLEAGLVALRQPSGSVVVAASQTIAELLLPEWLLAFRRRFPDGRVRLVAGNSATVDDLVRSGVAGVGFVEGPTVGADVRSRVVGEDELVVVVAPGHPWATAASLAAADLATTPLLVREAGSGTRAALEAWLGRTGAALATPAAVLETTGIIRATARAGVAPAVLSARSVAADLADGTLVRVPLDGTPIVREFRAVWNHPASADVEAFLQVAAGRSGSRSR